MVELRSAFKPQIRKPEWGEKVPPAYVLRWDGYIYLADDADCSAPVCAEAYVSRTLRYKTIVVKFRGYRGDTWITVELGDGDMLAQLRAVGFPHDPTLVRSFIYAALADGVSKVYPPGFAPHGRGYALPGGYENRGAWLYGGKNPEPIAPRTLLRAASPDTIEIIWQLNGRWHSEVYRATGGQGDLEELDVIRGLAVYHDTEEFREFADMAYCELFGWDGAFDVGEEVELAAVLGNEVRA